MLDAFDIRYLPCTTVKGKVLIDLLAEFTQELDPNGPEEVGQPKEAMRMNQVTTQQVWQFFVDGAPYQKGSGIGIVIISPKGITLEKSLRLGFQAMNNEVEYEALQARIVAIQKIRAKSVKAFCDSRLIARQVRGELATPATSIREKLRRIILVEELASLAYDTQIPTRVHFMQVGPSWIGLVISFFKDGTLSEDRTEEEKV